MKITDLYLTLLLLLLFHNCEGCKEEEREALLQIKSSMQISEGSALSDWYGKDCCQWEGLECDVSTSRIVKIFLRYRRIREKVSDQVSEWYPDASLFAQFIDLQEIYLPGNKIGGFVSPNALSKLKLLKKLDLHDNWINNGPHLCWGNIPTLFHLDLSRNKLQGHIPQCLCDGQSFGYLDLSQNELEGNIDACLSNMNSLKHLFLSDNHFSGKFPSLLFHNLTNIQSFAISRNKFEDLISLHIFSNLSKLSYLDVSFNPNLEIETESPTCSPSFSLKQLKLGGCNLNKRSGGNIPRFLSTQYHLESLDLSYNSLVGSFPSWLLYNISSELWIRGNNLSSLFPRSQRNMSSRLAKLDISDNMLYGSFPKDINHIFPELCVLNASDNMFNGTIPQSLSAMRKLQNLDLSSNDFNGEIPKEMLNNMTYLEFLDLSSNNIERELYTKNFSLPKLRWLYLNKNGFVGSFPYGLSNCPSLQIVNICDNDLSGKLSRNLPVLPHLQALILRGNGFSGSIPHQMCLMKHLHILDLSGNDFSGEIPTCLDNITSMREGSYMQDSVAYSWLSVDMSMKGRFYTYPGRLLPFLHVVDISSNQLTGTIPIQMSELRALISLNVSNNLLTGQISESLGNMSYLESLDLSCNNLSDNIPYSLVHLVFLEYFNVSYNSLSGPIPSQGQFATFDSSSYQGNANLCGRPLEKKCDQSVGETKPEGEGNNQILTEVNGRFTLIVWSAFLFLVGIDY